MDNVELIKTRGSQYTGRVTCDNATGCDEYGNDVDSIIIEPLHDPGVEIWVPTKYITSRSILVDAKF